MTAARKDPGLPGGYLNLVSGAGRNIGPWPAAQEGPRYAIEDMTEERLVTLSW